MSGGPPDNNWGGDYQQGGYNQYGGGYQQQQWQPQQGGKGGKGGGYQQQQYGGGYPQQQYGAGYPQQQYGQQQQQYGGYQQGSGAGSSGGSGSGMYQQQGNYQQYNAQVQQGGYQQQQQPQQQQRQPYVVPQQQQQHQQSRQTSQPQVAKASGSAVPGKLQPRQVASGGSALPTKLQPRQVESNQFGKTKGKDAKKVVLPMPVQPTPAAPAAAADKGDSPKPKPKAKAKSFSISASGKKEDKKSADEAAKVDEAKSEVAAPAPEEPKEAPKEEKKVEVVEKPKDKKPKKEYKRDPRPHLNVVFIGHVDAGKSTISGNMMVLSGCVDERTMEKYEREAKQKNREGWSFAYVMDLDDQEREKGKTHETGAGYFETSDRRYTILDAPGHKAFVPSMIGGACQADIAILVISARKGEFETGFDRGGQTREHALLVKTCGVRFLAIVINKMDEPSVLWSEERYNEIESKLTPYLKQIGFAKSQFCFLPVSGITGAGLKKEVDSALCPWFSGKSLQGVLNDVEAPGRKNDDPVRFPIHGKYKDEGKVHIHGKLESGTFACGDKLLMQPTKNVVTIEGILLEDHNEEAAFAGDHLILKVKGVEEDDVRMGYVLTDPETPLKNVIYFHAQVMILDVKNIITSGYTCVMHAHALAEEVVFHELLATINKKTQKISEKYPKFVRGNESVMVRMEVANPICLEESKTFGKMGRFILRDEGKTIAIGVVTKLFGDKKMGDFDKPRT